VLSGPVFIRYINGNSALPGATVQGLHVDTQGEAGNKLAVNFGVEDITPHNGGPPPSAPSPPFPPRIVSFLSSQASTPHSRRIEQRTAATNRATTGVCTLQGVY
jgi:hypothetical protein